MTDQTPTPAPTIKCSHGGCVDVKRHDAGVTLTSTIAGNDGEVTYTQQEWNAFMRQVRDGDWDHTADN